MTDYHVPEADLLAYAGGGLDDAAAWSVEAHLDRCAHCRVRVRPAGVAGPPGPLPVQGRVRPPTRLRRIGLLIGAAPGARLGWLLALALTVLLALGAGLNAGPPGWLLLLVAPILPVAGTALSYGPRTDPLHEIVAATPYGGLRILLWRTVSVLTVSVPVSLLAGLTSGLGTPVVWLLPALALSGLTLALAGPLDPAHAAGLVGAGWAVLVLSTRTAGATLVTAASAPAWAAVLATVVVLIAVRDMRPEVAR